MEEISRRDGKSEAACLALALAWYDAITAHLILHGDGTGRPLGLINIEAPPAMPDIPLKIYADDPAGKPRPFYQTIRSKPRRRK